MDDNIILTDNNNINNINYFNGIDFLENIDDAISVIEKKKMIFFRKYD